MSFFIHQLCNDPLEAYVSDPGRSCSKSSSGGADIYGAGSLTSYRLDINFDAGGSSSEDLGRVDRFDEALSFIN